MKHPTALAERAEPDELFERARLDTLETGFLLACYQTLLIALRDRRLAFKHRAVLAVLIEHMNGQTGMTWIGRERIASVLGLASKTVSNAIYELMAFGYILAENRRTPETSNRSLRHYTLRKLSRDEIERQLTDAIAAIKASGPTSKVPADGEFQSPHGRGIPAPKSPPAVLESPRRRGAVTNEEKLTRERVAPPAHDVPHLNELGFVISAHHDIVIPMETVRQWRTRFPAIPDLEAQMGKLSAVILRRGHSHPGWLSPAAWMGGCLANDNADAASKAKRAAAKPKASRW